MNCPHCSAPNADDARFCGSCGKATSATEPTSNPGMGMPKEAPSLIGRQIAGRYRINEKLGEGGMGAVYKAEQISLKRTVAVKLLRPEVASSPTLVQRFNAEAQAVAKLSHPNTVNIYDFGQDSDGTLFIAMELIEGRSLRHVIHKEAPLTFRRALNIAQLVAASLTDAHSHAIVHRDLKPDNVMLQQRGRQQDVVRVLDFGIAKLRDEGRATQMQMTQAGDMLGTPQYMAPEQIRAEQIDGRTDVYALGCMLYEMITGRLPFEAPTVMSLLSKHLLEVVVAPSGRRPDLQIPPALDQLILNAMAKDIGARPPTMEQFGEQIAAIVSMLPVDTKVGTAQVPVPTGAQAIPTPPAMTPIAPSVFAPSSPPPGAPPPGSPYAPPPQPFVQPTPPHGLPPQAPPPGFVSTPSGYVPAPPGAAPYDPRTTPYPAPSPPPAKKRNAAMWIIIALLVLGGGGAAVYFAAFANKSATVAQGSGSAIDDDDEEAIDASSSGTDDPVAIDASTGTADPWGGGASNSPGTIDAADDDDPSPGFIRAMQGVRIKLPDDFALVKQTSTEFAAKSSIGAVIAVFPIGFGTDHVDELAKQYANDSHLEIINSSQQMVGGSMGKLFAFTGKIGNIESAQIGAALIGPTYRVGVIYHLPVDAYRKDPTLGNKAEMWFATGIELP